MTECAYFREAAAELALGILTGPERSAALAHVDQCACCQAEMTSLAVSADRLLDIAPARRAPDGFEERMAAAFTETLPDLNTESHRLRPSHRGFADRRWQPGAVAAAVAAAGLLGFLLNGTVITTPQPPTYNREVIVALRTPVGVSAGEVAVTGAPQHWLVMVVSKNAAVGRYHCFLRISGGQQIYAGVFRVGPEGGVWVSQLPIPESKLTGVRIVGPGGTQAASATFS